MKRLAVIGGFAAVMFATHVPAAVAYDPTGWSRAKAYSYANAGVYERYVYGGSTYLDNNRWDSNEGADCSGYAAKVWAVEHYTSPGTVYHPYSTSSFYYGFPYEVFKDRNKGSYMEAWVFRTEAGGPSNHMGLFKTINSDGTWNTFEARGSSYGIVIYRRSISTLLNWNYKHTDRANWGP